MDLALELGMPVSALRKAMTERELTQWARYANKHHLPTRRLELYLAQITLVIARTMGGATEVDLTDFLFDPPAPVDPAEQLQAAIEAFEFKPRKTKNG